jgi:biotin operon repressor
MSTKDQEYAQAFADWAKEDPEGYAKAQALGVATPKLEHTSENPSAPSTKQTALDYASVDPVFPDDEGGSGGNNGGNFGIFGDPDDSEFRAKLATAVLEILYVMGAARSSETRIKARVLLALCAKEEDSFESIAQEEGITRQAISKLARQMKEGLGLTIEGSTRSKAYVEQSRERAQRIHDLQKDDLKRAEEIRKNKGAKP